VHVVALGRVGVLEPRKVRGAPARDFRRLRRAGGVCSSSSGGCAAATAVAAVFSTIIAIPTTPAWWRIICFYVCISSYAPALWCHFLFLVVDEAGTKITKSWYMTR
jgi:hypothetical protein